MSVETMEMCLIEGVPLFSRVGSKGTMFITFMQLPGGFYISCELCEL